MTVCHPEDGRLVHCGETDDPVLFDFEPIEHAYHYAGRRLPSVTDVLKDVGLLDTSGPWFTEEVRTRGSYVHRAIELWAGGRLDEAVLDPMLAPYLAAYQRWATDERIEILGTEERVFDTALGYAGTLDIRGRKLIAGRTHLVVVDVKTGQVPPSVAVQLAAYARPLAGFHHPYSLRLCADGTYESRSLVGDIGADEDWLAALRLYHWRTRHGLRRAH